jgi:hypothetical protein
LLVHVLSEAKKDLDFFYLQIMSVSLEAFVIYENRFIFFVGFLTFALADVSVLF